MDPKKINFPLPSIFLPILEELQKEGYIVTLVGGAVRDFFLHNDPGKDWDIEISHEILSFDKSSWKDLGKRLSRFGKLNFLPYEVIRLQADSYQFEFSPPRIEHFQQDKSGHSNFDAEFNFKLPFDSAVLRRDFTINAMGFRFNGHRDVVLMDPLDGLRHLREKVLHFAGPDFAKDPVRFLRAHRFANRLKFSFSNELKKLLDSMPLQGITPAYLWSELQKSLDPVNFLSFLVQENNKDLRLPVDKTFTGKVPEMKVVLSDPRKHETWIIALEWVHIPSEAWVSYFSLGQDSSRRLARWAVSSRDFRSIFPETFQGDFTEIRNEGVFERLFDWYFTTKQLLQKYPELPLLRMIEDFLPHWIHLFRFEPLKDVKHIDPPFRAKYQVWNLCQRL
jgi:hypothetical protein